MATSSPQQISVLQDGVEVIVVYGGPRGHDGLPGGDGDVGPPGSSITVRGAWDSNATYVPGDAVQSRTLASPGLQALWIVKSTGVPTQGFRPHEEPAEWSEISATSSAEDGAIYRIVQNDHPFTQIGEPAAFSATTGKYELADARDAGLLPVGLVCEISGTQEFCLQMTGRLSGVDKFLIFDPAAPAERGALDWVPGAVYYLSTAPGMLQIVSPRDDGHIEVPVAVPINEDGDLLILTWGPSLEFPPVKVVPMRAPRQEGEMIYRKDTRPGLYVALYDQTGQQLMWVQTNG